MGIVGIVWVLDSLIALWIAFPSAAAWRKSFSFRWHQGSYKRNFDLHRSGGVWVWGLLLIMAVTSVSMNLEFQVMRPVVSVFSNLSPSPYDTRTASPPDQPIEPRIDRVRAIEIAQAERRGWTAPRRAAYFTRRLITSMELVSLHQAMITAMVAITRISINLCSTLPMGRGDHRVQQIARSALSIKRVVSSHKVKEAAYLNCLSPCRLPQFHALALRFTPVGRACSCRRWC